MGYAGTGVEAARIFLQCDNNDLHFKLGYYCQASHHLLQRFAVPQQRFCNAVTARCNETTAMYGATQLGPLLGIALGFPFRSMALVSVETIINKRGHGICNRS